MEDKSRHILKTYFESGDTPTSKQFGDLIDSSLNKSDDQISVQNSNLGLGTATPQSKLDIAGGLSIGANYAGQSPAPPSGLLVEGKTGMGTNQPKNSLDVAGALCVGSDYVGQQSAPENGLLVQGKVGIGVTDPRDTLTVKGSIGIEEVSEHLQASFGKIYAKENIYHSLHFNGSNDYIDLSEHVQAFAALSTGTISFWYYASLEEFKPANLLWFGRRAQVTTSDMVVFIGQQAYEDDCLMTHIYSDGADPKLQMYVHRGINYFKDEKWHHVAITYGKGDNRIYLDGEESQTFIVGDINTENSFFNLPSNADGFLISYRIYQNNFELPLAGSLDEFAILKRPLTASEITQVFRSGRTFNLKSLFGPDLMGYWRMDEDDQEGIIRDHSGNDFHGNTIGTTLQTRKIKGLYYKDSDGIETALTGEGVSGQLSSVWDKIGPDAVYESGNIGIGTFAPDSKLHIKEGPTGQRAAIRLESTSGNAKTWDIVSADHAGQGTLGFSNVSAGIGVLTLTEGGNIGVMTSTPGATLDVSGSLKTKIMHFYGSGGDSSQSHNHYGIYQEQGPWNPPYPDLVLNYHTGIKYVAYYGYSGHRFYTGYTKDGTPATEAFSIGKGDHNVRVNHSLIVNGIIQESSATQTVGLRDGDGNIIFFNWTGNYLEAVVDSSRFRVTISSDKRHKKNIRTISGALRKVLKLRGVEFNWKNPKEQRKEIGLIAQEVDEVVPEVVNNTGEYQHV